MAKICVPVCVRQIDRLGEALIAASHLADIVEIRADCLTAPEPATLLTAAAAIHKPLVLTLRAPEEGGVSAISADTRRQFWTALENLPADGLIDLELDMITDFSSGTSAGKLQVDWQNVICSHHDFHGVPENLNDIFDRIAATPAGITKVAVQANDAVDCLPVFQLLDRAEEANRKIIAVAMGQAGVMTRVLGPSRGSFLTYGSLSDESGTAPGQLTAADLRDVYHIDRFDRHAQIFGIIGNPVTQSLSPHIHNAAFAANDLNAVYLPFEVHEAIGFIRRMVHPKTREIDWNLKGLSVTSPHKSMVMQCLDWIDEAAREIGAVNTIVVEHDELHGYNTDAAGFLSPLRTALGSIRDARCAVMGAGGAARACVWALKQEGADVTVFGRDLSQASFLAKTFGVKYQQLSPRNFAGFDLLVNTTPLGTAGEHEGETVVDAEQLCGVRLAYDLVYNPSETAFLSAAREAGCHLLGGLEMLLAQGVEQYKLWNGTPPDADVMRAAALRRLHS